MNTYTQEELDDLISRPKTIVDPPKRTMTSQQGSKRNDMVVEDSAGGRFGVFMRVSEKFPEDFSVGLRYDAMGSGSIILLRCNGPHGYVLGPNSNRPHFGFHIHRANVQNIAEGLRSERGAVLTTEYSTYEGALRYFLGIAGIEWNDEHFPGLRQRTFEVFDDDITDN